MRHRRALALLVAAGLATVAAVAASVAVAGGIRDEPCPNVAGENTNTCPPGKVGEPYSIRFRAVEEPPCAPGDDKWYIVSGSAPPGLQLNESDGTLSGTPTTAGTFSFYVEMRLPDYWIPEEGRGCNGTADTSQKQFTITILPARPKLVVGPEQDGVPVATVGDAYTLTLTANLDDPKTWSIVDGALPPGLALDPTRGVISGTPQRPGEFGFTVRAVIDESQSDTKSLTITVRDRLAVSFSGPPTTVGALTRWEVGVPFTAALSASGGSGSYAWRLSGTLPDRLTFVDGAITGQPLTPGAFRFAVVVTDSEGRVAVYRGRLVIVPRIEIGAPAVLRSAVVRRPYQARIVSRGGVAPFVWRAQGSLPRGVRFDRGTATLAGVPRRPGRFRVTFQVTDRLGVVATRSFLLIVVPPTKR